MKLTARENIFSLINALRILIGERVTLHATQKVLQVQRAQGIVVAVKKLLCHRPDHTVHADASLDLQRELCPAMHCRICLCC